MVAWILIPFRPAATPTNSFEDRTRETVLQMRFTLRRRIANLLPLVLILLSIVSYVEYQQLMDRIIREQLGTNGAKTAKDVLQHVGTYSAIPYHGMLQAQYLGIFLFAEAAFVVMALREYAYGVLKIFEDTVLGHWTRVSAQPRSPVPSSSTEQASVPHL